MVLNACIDRIGGLGLVLVCVAVVVFGAAAISPDMATAVGAIPRFYDFTFIIAVIGAVFGAGERYLQHRLKARGLEMMAAVTEQLVHAATPDNHRLNPGEVRERVESVFNAVWMPSDDNRAIAEEKQ